MFLAHPLELFGDDVGLDARRFRKYGQDFFGRTENIVPESNRCLLETGGQRGSHLGQPTDNKRESLVYDLFSKILKHKIIFKAKFFY